MTTAAPDTRRGLSRAVVWTGIALGTCLAVMAMWDGARLRVGGMPSWAGVFLGAVIVWALIAGASVALAELIRRHHKTAARYAARQGKRGGAVAVRGARRHGGRLAAAAAAWAGSRFHGREHQPLLFTRSRRDDAEDHPDAPELAGMPEAPAAPEAPAVGGAPEPSDNPPGGTSTMPAPAPMSAGGTAPSRITPGRRARGAAARSGGSVPGAWNAIIARTADFEPENDGDLLDWMGDEVAGVAAYAEALVDLYEACTQGIGLDPVAMAALHDVADAQAHASETMSGARRKFADHYDRPREFAAEGGLMPHDGRWVTGEGDA